MNTPIFVDGIPDRVEDTVALFDAVFSASEGSEEGRIVSTLARDLIETTRKPDIYGFCAELDGSLAGAIFFSRLSYVDDPRQVFLLSPVAVATAHQGKGIGQALIRHGLDGLRQDGIDIAVTYGDPAFYGRVGFEPVTTEEIPAPHPLSQPHGWLATILTDEIITPLSGPSTAVPAFNAPGLW